MRIMSWLLGPIGLAVLGLAPLMNRAAEGPYHSLKEIPVGGQGGFDYLSVDPDAHRLYATHGTKIVVVDTEKDAICGEVDDTPGVHGFPFGPDLKRRSSTNCRE